MQAEPAAIIHQQDIPPGWITGRKSVVKLQRGVRQLIVTKLDDGILSALM